MNRRHALRHLLGGFTAGGLLLPSMLFGQSAPSAPPAGTARTRPAATGAAASFQASPAVVQMLEEWERYTRNINKLEGEFERIVYDSTFIVERRAYGKFWYEAPDKGRIDFKPMNLSNLPVDQKSGKPYNPHRAAPSGTGYYTVLPDASKRWICRGDLLIDIDDDQKTYETTEIPPQMRGVNITASPLPFLFGVTADEMQRRYFLSLGSMHDPLGQRPVGEGRRANPQIHVVAAPRLESIAREWSRAEILLDPGTKFRDDSKQPIYLPTAIRLIDPPGTQETVYVFKLDDTKLNSSSFFGSDPFKVPSTMFSSYKLLGHHRHAAAPDPSKIEAAAPGKATVN